MVQRLDIRLLIGLLLAGSFVGLSCADSKSATAPETDEIESAAEVAERDGPRDGPRRPVHQTWLEDIDWETALQHAALPLARLGDDEARQTAQRSPVPVLLPDDGGLLESAKLTVGEAWYAASMSGDDHTVVFSGTHRVRDIPGAANRKEDAHMPVAERRLTRTHGIVTVAFEKFGVYYAVDVECENPLENTLCTEDDYVLSLIDDAKVVREAP